jgi:lambda repressor-like predicted transcriptional regulator
LLVVHRADIAAVDTKRGTAIRDFWALRAHDRAALIIGFGNAEAWPGRFTHCSRRAIAPAEFALGTFHLVALVSTFADAGAYCATKQFAVDHAVQPLAAASGSARIAKLPGETLFDAAHHPFVQNVSVAAFVAPNHGRCVTFAAFLGAP